MRAHEPPSQPTEMWAGGCEIDFVINRELLARPVVGHRISQAQPAVLRITRKRLELHIQILAIELMQPHSAEAVGAGPYGAPRHHRIDIEPWGALDRWSPAISSAAVPAHESGCSSCFIIYSTAPPRPPRKRPNKWPSS